jgi:hypothetical protein
MIPKAILARLAGRKRAPGPTSPASEPAAGQGKPATERPKEIGGPAGPEPTRYGDWERNGRCIDF